MHMAQNPHRGLTVRAPKAVYEVRNGLGTAAAHSSTSFYFASLRRLRFLAAALHLVPIAGAFPLHSKPSVCSSVCVGGGPSPAFPGELSVLFLHSGGLGGVLSRTGQFAQAELCAWTLGVAGPGVGGRYLSWSGSKPEACRPHSRREGDPGTEVGLGGWEAVKAWGHLPGWRGTFRPLSLIRELVAGWDPGGPGKGCLHGAGALGRWQSLELAFSSPPCF